MDGDRRQVVQLTAPVLRRLRPIRRSLSSPSSIWKRGLPAELEYWTDYLSTGGGQSPNGYQERLDPHAPVTDPVILEAIERTLGDPVRILDVGAGPLTILGKRHPTRRLEIVATDPLANQYDLIFGQFGIAPPVRTRQCRGEDITSVFGQRAFDIAHARNCIDHSARPMDVIDSMVAAVRPGGTIVLRHYRSEGQRTGYATLHQWNFDVQNGRLVIWGRRRRYDVARRLEGRATVRARLEPGGNHADWVEAVIRPLPT
ncbi:MAG: class I SAM-dependent methyltransferase [Jatrophihabitantaceae bacterium]